MKAIGITLIILALALAIVPQFFTCQHYGKAIALPDGRTIAMKCLYAARAEIPLAAVLGTLGILFTISRERETRRFLSILGIIGGVFSVLLYVGKGAAAPLIGVCMKPDMPCVVIGQPSVFLIGGIITTLSIVATVMNFMPVKRS